MEQETTFYRFLSEIRAFLSKLVKNPMKADVNKYLKERNFNKTKTINVLLKRDVLERHEKILDSTNSDEKEPKYTVKYKVRKKDFEDRIYKIYIQYFEKNLPEKKQEIKECDGGDVAGATSADVCNMSAPILPLGQPQHRTINGVSKKKKNEPSDILGKTITAESANKKHKICYITEEQLEMLIGEDISEKMSGIDDRMVDLAKIILNIGVQLYQRKQSNALLPASQINKYQNYFNNNKPLNISYIYNDNILDVAIYNYASNTITLNFGLISHMDINSIIASIMHELTHMVNFNKGNETTLSRYDINNKTPDADIINRYTYLFNPSEMQARLSQYYHYCKLYNNPVGLYTPQVENILCLLEMKRMVNNVDQNIDIPYNLYNLLRIRHGKEILKSKDADTCTLEINNFIKKYYNYLYQKYLKKATKIFNKFKQAKTNIG